MYDMYCLLLSTVYNAASNTFESVFVTPYISRLYSPCIVLYALYNIPTNEYNDLMAITVINTQHKFFTYYRDAKIYYGYGVPITYIVHSTYDLRTLAKLFKPRGMDTIFR